MHYIKHSITNILCTLPRNLLYDEILPILMQTIHLKTENDNFVGHLSQCTLPLH